MADVGPVHIDSQSALSFGLVLVLLAGGVQYGRQSERLDAMGRRVEELTIRIEKLTDAVAALRPQPAIVRGP